MGAWTRRKVLGASAAAASALACNGARAQERALKITWNGWTEEQTKPLMEGFEAANPGIKAAYERIPFTQILQTLEVRLSARTPEPDVFSVDSPLTASYAVRGHLEPLDAILDRRLFTKAAQDAASFRGKLYSAPFASSSQVLFYNRALFKAAGIEPPTLDVQNRWTWEKVVDAAKMSDPAKNQWGFVIEQAERPYQLLPFGQSLGGQAIGEDGLKATGFIDGQPFVDGFTFMQRLYTDWRVSPPGMFDNTLTPEVFGSGRAAMFLGNTFNYDTFSARYKDLDWGVAPHPYFEKGRPVTPTGSWHIGVNPRSRNKEAAAAFIRYMTSDDTQALWFKLRPYVPVLQSSWTKQAAIFDSPQWRIARHELDNTAVVRPATPGYREYEDILRVALRDITAGADVKTQLSQAAQRIDRELQKYRG